LAVNPVASAVLPAATAEVMVSVIVYLARAPLR
jgi:hypothetical protein